ncbi:hypothetical protein SFHH103_psfHH103d_105 (plasmid) [Sinorhizobium fredii HH103]|nr:hypothetical protein SFHH103_04533 [Sinorhizobium fredii HH103]CEO91301.1 hypothetical protein SFHH103_psfHH103d_105 [Sinorhizobium fredii HH103]
MLGYAAFRELNKIDCLHGIHPRDGCWMLLAAPQRRT